MARCRDCQAPVRYVATPTGRRMCIDVDPTPTGNVVILDGLARVLTADQLAQRNQPAQRWMPHAATCPRRRRR